MDWREEYQKKLCAAQEAVKIVEDGDVVHIGTASSVAKVLAEALYERRNELHDVTVSSGVMTSILPIYTQEVGGPFSVLTYFAGPAEREAMKQNNCRCASLHLSQLEHWRDDMWKDGVAFLEVSPPDRFGYMSYGAYELTVLQNRTAAHSLHNSACLFDQLAVGDG